MPHININGGKYWSLFIFKKKENHGGSVWIIQSIKGPKDEVSLSGKEYLDC